MTNWDELVQKLTLSTTGETFLAYTQAQWDWLDEHGYTFPGITRIVLPDKFEPKN